MSHEYSTTQLANLHLGPALPLFANRPRHRADEPYHDHDFIEVTLVAGGTAVHSTIAGDRPLARGDVLILHPGQWHGYLLGEAAREPLDIINVCLPSGLFVGELSWVMGDPQVAALVNSTGRAQEVVHFRLADEDLDRLLPLAARAVALAGPEANLRHRTELIGVAGTLLASLGALMPLRHLRHRGDGPVDRATVLLEADLARPWTLQDLASRTGVSREHLVRRFRAVHRMPPLAWLNRRRAERAAVLLLATDGLIRDIGSQVGWPDPTHFTRRFRAAFATTPGAYRSRAQQRSLRKER